MTWIVLVMISLLGAVLQAWLPAVTFLGQAKFPILLGIVIYYALSREIEVMLVAALLAGWLQDALSFIPLGYSVCVFALAGWIVSRFRVVVVADSWATAAFMGLLSGWGVTLLLYGLLRRGGDLNCSVGWALMKILGTGLLGAVCAPAMGAVIRTIDRHVGNVEAREGLDDF